ncbi:hypothetical protein R6Q59_031153 [Mikania micrantha]
MSVDQAKIVEEKEAYESKVKDLELQLESVTNLKKETEAQLTSKGVEISELLITSQNIKEDLERKSKEQEKTVEEKEGFQSLREELEGKSKEQEKTVEEKESYESKVKDLELQLESLNNLKIESELQLEKKCHENSELLIQIQSLREELEGKSKEQEKTVEEKESYESKVKDLELQLERLNSLKNESELQLEKKAVEISELLILVQSLQEKFESKLKEQEKTVEEKEGYESKVKDLELQLESIKNLKNASELELEKKDVENSELLIQIQNLKEELEGKSKEQQKTVEEKQLESLNNLKTDSDSQLEKKAVEISELVILVQSLKEELESKSKEQEKTAEEKGGYESKVKDLELKFESLNNLKKASELELENMGVENSELLIQIENLKEQLEGKSKEQQKTMEEKEGYESNVKDLELQLESLNNMKNASELELEKRCLENSESLASDSKSERRT